MKLTVTEWKELFCLIAERIEENKDRLSELDRAVGDGDHGVTMSIGWQAIVKKLEESQGADCGAVCKEMAMTFLNAVGSSVGPLYATAFLRGASLLQGKEELTEEDVVAFWQAAVSGIQERGKAQIGDKTMLDAWLPAMQALEQARMQGRGLAECMEEAAAAGEQGMKATALLVPQVGRSSRLGERAVGHLDPGAASASIILTAFAEGLRKTT
ncbi:dihydroxyacetone kinase subunit L [Paenibacillus sp. J31TS4]|uniref:dihydroxyacetone kinase subunit DhaL n=1 Tax=Paenibacillus sp. J31TS4 TaxID=2807195 RepID=UPI001B0E8DB5|nr:dihydroxyacetone kinase subunit DhaL [Paenibacillus sp. J31TS4]GIP41391.1 dihydroxyacetone kinase subunit L [Paenibacillus sp. J31TS4]